MRTLNIFWENRETVFDRSSAKDEKKKSNNNNNKKIEAELTKIFIYHLLFNFKRGKKKKSVSRFFLFAREVE